MTFLELILKMAPVLAALILVLIKVAYIKDRGKHFIGRLDVQYVGYYKRLYIRETSSQQKKEFMLRCNHINTAILLFLSVGISLIVYDVAS